MRACGNAVIWCQIRGSCIGILSHNFQILQSGFPMKNLLIVNRVKLFLHLLGGATIVETVERYGLLDCLLESGDALLKF